LIKVKQLFLIAVCLLFPACSRQETASEGRPIASDPNQVRLSVAAAGLAKIISFPVTTQADLSEIDTTGQIKADENRVFHINSIVAGRVVKDNVVLGNVIREGEQLAVIQNLDVAKTYGEYIHEAHQNEVDVEQTKARLELANKTVERLKGLSKEGIVAEKDLLNAQSQQKLLQIELEGHKEHSIHIKSEAKALLGAYGVGLPGGEQGGPIDARKIETGSPLIAPRSGVVIQKNVTVGDVVNPAQPLYVVADLSQVWLDVAIYDKDLAKLKEGEAVVFKSDSLPGFEFTGRISYIQPSAGDGTRTFLARAVLPNPKLVLKPGMFGQIKVTGIGSDRRPYLPDKALQKFGNEDFVFVDKGDNLYEKRQVELGTRVGDGYLVNKGISPGELVVGSGSFKLKSELLKSQIGNED
jgi:cobalt-zinc-cadmium efflux system membrane fusion protein